MKIKYLVTSGCSFSDNFACRNGVLSSDSGRWPNFLAERLNLTLFNRGHGSSGNDWISKSIIYQVQRLIDDGVKPEEILVGAMWSGIDRKSIFISSRETDEFAELINTGQPNPINFLDYQHNHQLIGSEKNSDGYLVGSAKCLFENKKLNKFKQGIIRYFCDEALAIESYENFLRVQWYCESNGLSLFNLTFCDILHYPGYNVNEPTTKEIMTKDFYRNIKPLFNMIDFSSWLLWKETGGMFEYAKDNNLEFSNDNFHPSINGHRDFVDEFLIPGLAERGMLKQSVT